MMKVISILAAACILFTTGYLLTGCGTTASTTQQIASQEKATALDIAKASYLDARYYYNEAQETFIRNVVSLPMEKRQSYSEALDEMGVYLDAWGVAISLGKYNNAEDKEKFLEAKNKLIDLGFHLLVD
jgi:hypothetical protein